MRVLLVDDETLAIDRLRTFFGDIEGVEVVGEAARRQRGARKDPRARRPIWSSWTSRCRAATASGPPSDIDVEPRPELVFVTAHEHYAPDAFEVEAADYLLKPVRFDRLRQAVDRARRRRAQRASMSRAEQLEAEVAAAARRRAAATAGRRRLLGARAPRPAPGADRDDRLDRGGARLCAAAHGAEEPFAEDHDGGAGGKAGGLAAVAGAPLGLRAAGPGGGGAGAKGGSFTLVLADGAEVQVGPSYVAAARDAIGFD